jgi:hypothetical protein
LRIDSRIFNVGRTPPSRGANHLARLGEREGEGRGREEGREEEGEGGEGDREREEKGIGRGRGRRRGEGEGEERRKIHGSLTWEGLLLQRG